mmetsp:Transcript_21835/g.47458  ORF Transcript_21835/g.47458 Transcript_21835/m.47458 type:complete len:211 (+) Transcript_21835:2925-3557(+)
MNPLAVSSVRPLLLLRRSATRVSFSTKARTSATAISSLISHRDMDKCVRVVFSSKDSKRYSQSSFFIFFRPSSLRMVSDGSSSLSFLTSFFKGVLSVGMSSRGSLGSVVRLVLFEAGSERRAFSAVPERLGPSNTKSSEYAEVRESPIAFAIMLEVTALTAALFQRLATLSLLLEGVGSSGSSTALDLPERFESSGAASLSDIISERLET